MPSSRFLLWDSPVAYPHYDLILRDTTGPVFDLGVDLDDYNGSVFLKADHVIEMARDLGMATTDEVQELLKEIQDLKNQIEILPVAQEELKDGLDSLVSNFYNHLHSGERTLSIPVPDSEPDHPKSPKAKPEPDGAFKL